MIVELLLYPVFLLIQMIVSLFPSLPQQIYDLSGLVRSIGIGLSLLPTGWFPLFVGNVIFFKTFGITWAMIEWVYKKIPGVD